MGHAVACPLPLFGDKSGQGYSPAVTGGEGARCQDGRWEARCRRSPETVDARKRHPHGCVQNPAGAGKAVEDSVAILGRSGAARAGKWKRGLRKALVAGSQGIWMLRRIGRSRAKAPLGEAPRPQQRGEAFRVPGAVQSVSSRWPEAFPGSGTSSGRGVYRDAALKPLCDFSMRIFYRAENPS